MGTSWSHEGEGSSQQVQPFSHQQPQAIVPPKVVQASTIPTGSSGRNNTNNHNNIKHHNNNETANRERKEVVKLPHNFEAIIKDSDSPIDKTSLEKLYEKLHAGVYLNGQRKKYWVEKKGNINCFMVFARGLSITWAEDEKHWYWHDVQTREGQITVAQLRNVCWLEVHGRFHTANLTPGVTYEVAYLIMLEPASYGWEKPVNFRLTLPNGSKQERKESLKDKPRDEWVRVHVGEFKVTQENVGEIEFSLYEYEGGCWKKGLIVKGATIEPKI